MYLPEYKVYKIGCTSKGLGSRFSRGKEVFEVLYTKEYSNSAVAYAIEDFILRSTYTNRTKGIHLKSKGSSELRDKAITNIEELVLEAERLING